MCVCVCVCVYVCAWEIFVYVLIYEYVKMNEVMIGSTRNREAASHVIGWSTTILGLHSLHHSLTSKQISLRGYYCPPQTMHVRTIHTLPQAQLVQLCIPASNQSKVHTNMPHISVTAQTDSLPLHLTRQTYKVCTYIHMYTAYVFTYLISYTGEWREAHRPNTDY